MITVNEEKADGTVQQITRSYDALNRVSQYTDIWGRTIRYTYDWTGNVACITYPDKSEVHFGYYDNGQLETVTDWEGSVTRYEYDQNGRQSSIQRPDGSKETFQYNPAGSLTEQEDRDSEGNLLQRITYRYNGFGELAGKTRTGEGAEKRETRTEQAEESPKTEQMEYNAANQLIRYNGERVEYDAYGNMTYGPSGGSMAYFTYDSRNRLKAVQNLTYEYDAENNRVASCDSQTGKTIRYIHNTNSSLSQLLEENDGTTTTKYVYGNALISSRTYQIKADSSTCQTVYYYHYDNVESTTMLTDETGAVVETYDYTPYGRITRGDRGRTRFLYNGGLGVSTDENGLYYMRARYYNPDICRFVNQDTEKGSLSSSASLNRYAYVQGNPVTQTDPFGLSPLTTASNYGLAALGIISKLADTAIDFTPVGVVRDVKRCYDSIKRGDTKEAVKSGISALAAVALPAAKAASRIGKTAKKLLRTRQALKAEKAMSQSAKLAEESLKLAEAGNKAKKTQRLLKEGDAVADTAKTVTKASRGTKVKRASHAGTTAKNTTGSIPMDLQLFGGKSGSKTDFYYHSCADEVADIIADTGFRTDLPNERAAFQNNRYGRGVYLADSPATALAERPGGTILKVSGNTGRNLDITSRGVIGGDDYTMTHAIARGARKHGYDSITFMSAKNPTGVNTVIFNPANVKVEEILR
ncbi:MAG: hypothetical protein PUC39_01350 [Lachnospiraceae bacterium]|nr:hypothetical protein [Lachnospiraceae bacterium]